MTRIYLISALILAGCGNSTNTGGATADTQIADVHIDDSDALADTAPDCGQITETTCCCAGDVAEKLLCSAGAWTCPKGFGLFHGDQCNGSKCGGPCSMACPMDVVDTSDVPDTAPVCPGLTETTCCCADDVVTDLVCSAGAWKCPAGYSMFTGKWCSSECGSPCSLPCADAGPTDTGPQDTGTQDTGPKDDVKPSDAAALCMSTGGSVVTAKCCSASSDFPDTCGIGGCTCAPAYLKDIQKCECAVGKCFKVGTGCQ